MGESKELKPKSFRIDDATADRFKEIAAQIGGNQQETLSKLIEAYEFQGGKAVLTEKKADIDQFEKYVNALTRMFMGSLEDNQNITATVRTEFEARLKSKDTVIQDLQEKLQTAKQAKEQAASNEKAAQDEQNRLVIELSKSDRNHEDTVKTYESKITSLNDTVAALNNSTEMMKEKIENLQKEVTEAETVQSQMEQLSTNLNIVEKELESVKKERDQDAIKHERELLELEKRYREEKQAAIDQYQAKYLELLEKMQNQEKSLLTTK